MRTILFIIQKEFIQIFRNRMMLPIIFVMPIIQLLVLGFAATFEIKNIKLCIIDNDLSSTSRQLTGQFYHSPFFKVTKQTFSMQEAENTLKTNTADLILHIPVNFEQQLVRDNGASVQVIANAINATVAGVATAYTQSIIRNFNMQVIADFFQIPTKGTSSSMKQLSISHQFWFNPELNYPTYMVPGILVLLVTLIGMFLSSLNLVREKEIGTIEQLNVTPIQKHHFIIGKLMPFWLIGMFELAFGLTVAKVVYDIPMVGNVVYVFLCAAVYLLVVLGLGLLASTLADTQQQVMFIAYFFMLVFILMSGLFTATESMPMWAQNLNYINPISYFMKIIRMILLKGAGLHEVRFYLFALMGYALVALSLATWRYHKVS